MTLRTSIIIDLAGNFARRSQEYGNAFGRFTARANRQMAMLHRGSAALGRGLDRIGNRYTALLTGAGAVLTGRFLVDLEARLSQLGVNADVSAEGINRLKQRLFEVAQSPDIKADPGELLTAIEEIVKRTGRLDLAVDNLENIGRTMRAAGAAGVDVGATVANLFEKFDVRTAEDVLAAIDTFARQGKAGAFELKDFATQMNEVAAAYAATGRRGPQAAREMGAILQMVMRTSGSAPEAATNFERMMATLTSEKISELRDRGIQLFDPEQLKKGVKEFRPIPDIIKDIIKATGGDEEKLSDVFDIRAMRAIRAFALEFKAGRGFEAFDNFLQTQGTGAQLIADAGRNAKTAAAAMQSLATAWKLFADRNLTGPIQALANLLDKLGSERTQTALKVIGGIAAGLGALAIGRKLVRGVGGLLNPNTWKPGGGGIAGGLGGLGGMPLPLPVYVVNKHMSLLPGQWGGGPVPPGGGKGGGRAPGLLRRAGPLLGRAGLFGAAGVGGYQFGSFLNDLISRGLSAALGREATLGTALFDLLHGGDDMRGEITVKIDQDGKARVAQVRKQGGGPDLAVDTGITGYVMP